VGQRDDIRVFAGAISTETNVFSPVPTDMASFRSHLFQTAGTLDFDGESAWPIPLEGFRQSCRRHGWRMVQGLCAAASPGGPVPQAVYEDLRDRLLADLAAALPVDMVALALHGAMIAAGCDDCEGDILARVRALVGPDVPVGAVLDPHAHLTAAMTDNATLLVFFKEYPHTDVFESAEAMIERLGACLDGGPRPTPSVFDCRMLSFYFTDREPMKGLVEAMRTLERQDGVLSVSLVHGFPWGDTPDMGAKVIVYTAGRPALGGRIAQDLGRALFEMRGRTLPDLASAAEAAAIVAAADAGPVVLADVADNPGGGAPGDATFLVRALMGEGGPRVAVGPFWDPLAVRQAFALGEGARTAMRIGGKGSPLSGAPLDVDVTVVRLSPDARQVVEGWSWPMGDTALLRFGNIDLVATSERLQCINTDIFTAVGIDARAYDALVVKSAQHFLAAYSAFAAQVVYVDTPATLFLGADPGRYRKLTRPKWPFDPSPFAEDGQGVEPCPNND
jgi:microcystin degradation protein MlrC